MTTTSDGVVIDSLLLRRLRKPGRLTSTVLASVHGMMRVSSAALKASNAVSRRANDRYASAMTLERWIKDGPPMADAASPLALAPLADVDPEAHAESPGPPPVDSV